MATSVLPPARTSGRYAIALVCLGNICRSPIAEVVLTSLASQAGLTGRVQVSSAGTGDWHTGQPMDERAAATLLAADYDPTNHLAQHFERSWLSTFDVVLAMDRDNLSTISALAGADHRDRVMLFRDFDPLGSGGEVPDPYYGGPAGFEEVLSMVERTGAQIVSAVREQLRADAESAR